MQHGALTRTWRGLVGVHRELEATPWGHLLLGNVWPAYLFALPLLYRLWGLAQRVWRGEVDPTLRAHATLVQELVTIAFLALIVVLLVRPEGLFAVARLRRA